MKYPAPAAFVAALSMLTACETTFVSENGQIRMEAPDLRAGLKIPFDNSMTVLEGTRLCYDCDATFLDDTGDTGGGGNPLLSCGDGFSNSDILTCFEQSVFRGAVDEDGCITLEGPDETAWLLSPTSCTVTDFWGFVPEADAVVFRVSDREQVYATFDQWPEDLARYGHDRGELVRAGGGGFDPGLRNPDFEPLRVVANQTFSIAPMLVDEVLEEPVAFNAGTARLELVHMAGPEALFEEGVTPATATIRPPAGSLTRVFLVLEGGRYTFVVGDVLGVSPTQADSLELVVAMEDTIATDDWGPPIAARGVVRDTAGRMLFGAPVEFSVKQGQLAVGGDEIIFPGADYTPLGDTCFKPDENTIRRTATLHASFGDLEDEVELAWTPYIDEDYALNIQNCQGSCGGCAATGPAGAGAGALLVLLAVGQRRRRLI